MESTRSDEETVESGPGPDEEPKRRMHFSGVMVVVFVAAAVVMAFRDCMA